MDIYSAKFSPEKKFYIYWYIRSKKSKYGDIGSPYYVGKGYGHRAYNKSHRVNPPIDRSQIQFVCENMNEADAFQLEMLMIYLYGRIDLGTGCLRNMSDGGEGAYGQKLSVETIAKRLSSRIKNGTTANNPKIIAKILATKKKNGTLDSSSKMVITRRKNGSYRKRPESDKKAQRTKLEKYGTLNFNTLESRAKSVETKKKNGTLHQTEESIRKQRLTKSQKDYSESYKKMIDTRRKNGHIKLSPQTIAKRTATRKLNGTYKRTPEAIAKGLATKLANRREKIIFSPASF